MRYFKVLCVLICTLVFMLFACSEPKVRQNETPLTEKQGRTALLSLFNDNNPWPIALAKDLQNAASKADINLIIKNAKGSAEQQYDDILSVDREKIDLILLSAVDKEIGAECLEICKDKGIPVMLVARNADGLLGQDYVTLMACDYELVGYSQGMSLVRLFGNAKCSIIELAGNPGASNTASIAMGFRRAIENYSNYSIAATKTTTTSTREALDAMESVIQSQTEFNAIFCHSDADALGAIQALKAAGLTPGCDPSKGEIIITSNCGFEDALKAVAIGELYSTIDLNARMGEIVVNTMQKYWNGEFITPRMQIIYKEITLQNVDEWIGKGY